MAKHYSSIKGQLRKHGVYLIEQSLYNKSVNYVTVIIMDWYIFFCISKTKQYIMELRVFYSNYTNRVNSEVSCHNFTMHPSMGIYE